MTDLSDSRERWRCEEDGVGGFSGSELKRNATIRCGEGVDDKTREGDWGGRIRPIDRVSSAELFRDLMDTGPLMTKCCTLRVSGARGRSSIMVELGSSCVVFVLVRLAAAKYWSRNGKTPHSVSLSCINSAEFSCNYP